ncbi:hypothetical protein [Nocardia sp. NPDC046763]|uniref:hypothetical protein n=1 Tax=Nocardia sp. NPDC046763 TaxID=3155256 RepID=UPI0033E74E59
MRLRLPPRVAELAARDLADDFSDGEVETCFAAYGLPDPDPARLAYYRLLDELF